MAGARDQGRWSEHDRSVAVYSAIISGVEIRSLSLLRPGRPPDLGNINVTTRESSFMFTTLHAAMNPVSLPGRFRETTTNSVQPFILYPVDDLLYINVCGIVDQLLRLALYGPRFTLTLLIVWFVTVNPPFYQP